MQPSGSDPRLSYCLHVPAAATTRPEGTRLVIVVHGSERRATAYRDAMVDFAEAQNCVVLAPLFPVGPFGDGHGDGYKYLVERDLRYDLALLDMVAETELRLGLRFERFGLFGFSGGGHFVHRFFYLHAGRLPSPLAGRKPERGAAATILAAIETVLADPELRTRDLGGHANTQKCGLAIANAMRIHGASK